MRASHGVASYANRLFGLKDVSTTRQIRLDRVVVGSHGVDELHDQRLQGSSLLTDSRPGPHDRVVLFQSAGHSLQCLDLDQLLRAGALALAIIDLVLDDPAAHGLPTNTVLLGHRQLRRRSTGVLTEVVSHQTHSARLELYIDPFSMVLILPTRNLGSAAIAESGDGI